MATTHRISAQAWFSLLGLALVIWLIVNHTALLFKLCWIVLGAFLLSLAIRPIADWLARRRIPRGLTTLLFFVCSLGLFAFFGGLLVPVIQAEAIDLQQRGPTLWQTLQVDTAGIPVTHFAPSAQSVVDAATGQWDTVLSTALGTVTGLSGLLLDLLILLSLTYFLTVDSAWGRDLILSWIPAVHHPHLQNMFHAISQRLTRWVWSQVALSLFFALAFSLGLWLLGIPFAFTIGLVGGLLTIVPYVGGLIGALLALLSALTIGIAPALWVVVLFIVVTVVHGHVLAPLLYGRAVGLHSALALLALFIGAESAGFVGVIFAVPVAVIVSVILQEVQGSLVGERMVHYRDEQE